MSSVEHNNITKSVTYKNIFAEKIKLKAWAIKNTRIVIPPNLPSVIISSNI